MNYKLALATVGLALATAPAIAAQAILGSSKDATIFQDLPDNGSGAGNGLFVGGTSTASPRRGLIAFNLAGIPSSATVQSVELTMTLAMAAGGGSGGGARTIELRTLAADWGEGNTQFADPPSNSVGGQGNGLAAASGDVTWNSRFHASTPATLWTPAGGGPLAPTASASASVGTTANSVHTWSSTAAMVADVQSWVSNPAANFGWLLYSPTETAATSFRAFYSRNVAEANFKPKLTVNYVVPEPSGASLVAVAALALSWRRGGARS